MERGEFTLTLSKVHRLNIWKGIPSLHHCSKKKKIKKNQVIYFTTFIFNLLQLIYVLNLCCQQSKVSGTWSFFTNTLHTHMCVLYMSIYMHIGEKIMDLFYIHMHKYILYTESI